MCLTALDVAVTRLHTGQDVDPSSAESETPGHGTQTPASDLVPAAHTSQAQFDPPKPASHTQSA